MDKVDRNSGFTRFGASTGFTGMNRYCANEPPFGNAPVWGARNAHRL